MGVRFDSTARENGKTPNPPQSLHSRTPDIIAFWHKVMGNVEDCRYGFEGFFIFVFV